MKDASTRRINRAVQTACEAATCDQGLADIKIKRFHAAMDELQGLEKAAVYARLTREPWYAAHSKRILIRKRPA